MSESELTQLGRGPIDARIRARMRRGVLRTEDSWYTGALGRATERIQVALEQHLEDLSEQVVARAEALGWYGAALYLVDSANTTLEAVAATGEGAADLFDFDIGL